MADPGARSCRPRPRPRRAPRAPEDQPGSVQESTAGKATRPGPSPSEEGWPGRDTGAGEEGFGSSTDKNARENPKPGLGGSQGTRER